eukprot:UN27935
MCIVLITLAKNFLLWLNLNFYLLFKSFPFTHSHKLFQELNLLHSEFLMAFCTFILHNLAPSQFKRGMLSIEWGMASPP